MSGHFNRRITIAPSFDHRFDPEKWRQGCGSMKLEFVLTGPLGAITASILTDWMYEPIVEIPAEYGRGWTGPWTNPVRARGKVGPDATNRRGDPMAGPISCHAAAPPQGKEWFTAAEGCTLIKGGVCYGDTGYIVGDEFFLRLAQGGDQAGFAFLREIHDDWLAPALPEAAS